MAHDMSGAALMIALMILMMAAMGGLSIAVLARKAPAAWLARITRTGPKPSAPASGAHRQDQR